MENKKNEKSVFFHKGGRYWRAIVQSKGNKCEVIVVTSIPGDLSANVRDLKW